MKGYRKLAERLARSRLMQSQEPAPAIAADPELHTVSEGCYRIGLVGKLIWLVSWFRRAGIGFDPRRVRDDGHAEDQLVTRVYPGGEHGINHAVRYPLAVGQVNAGVLQAAAHQVPQPVDGARSVDLR